MENLLSRIILNPEINHGKPGIRNTRYMVEGIHIQQHPEQLQPWDIAKYKRPEDLDQFIHQ